MTHPHLQVLRNLDCDESADVGVAAPVRMYSLIAFNNAAAVSYLKLYNTAVAATVGTTTPFMTIPLAAKGTLQLTWPEGIFFSTGISPGASTGVADADTGAPAANDVIVNIMYA